MLKNIKQFLMWVSFLPITLFGASGSNIARQLADQAKSEITESGKSIADIINTLSIVGGVIWILVMLFYGIF